MVYPSTLTAAVHNMIMQNRLPKFVIFYGDYCLELLGNPPPIPHLRNVCGGEMRYFGKCGGIVSTCALYDFQCVCPHPRIDGQRKKL